VRNEVLRTTADVKNAAAALQGPSAYLQLPPHRSEQEYLSELAEVSPAAAIMAAWREVERTLYEHSSGPEVFEGLPENLQKTLRKLWHLRNVLAHAPNVVVDKDTALTMVQLADALAKSIKVAKPSEGQPDAHHW
jgi:hypothetical protein